MPDQPPEKPSQVTLEQLLRLKRAEKPDPAFWDAFEQQYHQRRLQELVLEPARARWTRWIPRRSLAALATTGAAVALALAAFFPLTHAPEGVAMASVAVASNPVKAARVLPDHATVNARARETFVSDPLPAGAIQLRESFVEILSPGSIKAYAPKAVHFIGAADVGAFVPSSAEFQGF